MGLETPETERITIPKPEPFELPAPVPTPEPEKIEEPVPSSAFLAMSLLGHTRTELCHMPYGVLQAVESWV